MDNLKTGHIIQVETSTLLNTEDGILRADVLLPKSFLKGIDGSRQRIKETKLSSLNEGYNLSLKNGFNIVLGSSNMLYTIDGWKNIMDITSNDYVLHRRIGSLGKDGEKEILWDNVFQQMQFH